MLKKVKLHRDYCLFLDSRKYQRNLGCKAHDNAYGKKHGGGFERERRAADYALWQHMRAQGDPMAIPAYVFVRLFGWLYFYYRGRPWQGALIYRLTK